MPDRQESRPRVDPTARIHPTARLGADVTIGPGVIVGLGCVVGDRTRLGPRVVIVEHTTLGVDNDIHAGAVLGDDPQDLAYDPASDPGRLIVGDRNIIREFVTFHRGAGEEGPTRIGSDGFFMIGAHVGHNCVVGDRVILTNGAVLAGHVRLGRGCVMSAHAAVHQFCDVGECAMFQAGAGVSQHVPPFTIVHRAGNRLAGVNIVGLRRSGRFDREDIAQIREMYRLLFRSGKGLRSALDAVRGRDWRPGARRMMDFVEEAIAQRPPRARGVCTGGARNSRRSAWSDEDH